MYEKRLKKKEPLFPIQKRDQCKELLKLLREITDQEDKSRQLSKPFERLPSRKQMPEYYRVIARPIDFFSITSAVNRSAGDASKSMGYQWVGDFIQDVVQMFKNAIEYNREGSQLYNDAETLLGAFERLVKDTFPEYDERYIPVQLTEDYVSEEEWEDVPVTRTRVVTRKKRKRKKPKSAKKPRLEPVTISRARRTPLVQLFRQESRPKLDLLPEYGAFQFEVRLSRMMLPGTCDVLLLDSVSAMWLSDKKRGAGCDRMARQLTV